MKYGILKKFVRRSEAWKHLPELESPEAPARVPSDQGFEKDVAVIIQRSRMSDAALLVFPKASSADVLVEGPDEIDLDEEESESQRTRPDPT